MFYNCLDLPWEKFFQLGFIQPQKGHKFTEFGLELAHPFLKTMFLISRNVKKKLDLRQPKNFNLPKMIFMKLMKSGPKSSSSESSESSEPSSEYSESSESTSEYSESLSESSRSGNSSLESSEDWSESVSFKIYILYNFL